MNNKLYRHVVKNSITSRDKMTETDRLRAQVRKEIIESTKLCNYEPHECTNLRVENYNFCQIHILEDEKAPFKQCTYIYTTSGKKCHMPAAKHENKWGYCYEHLKKAIINKNKTTQKVEPVDSAEKILHGLIHYVKPSSSRTRTQSGNSDSLSTRGRTCSTSSIEKEDDSFNLSEDDSKLVITPNLDPFSEIDASKINSTCNEILEYASESDSDVEPTVYNNVWHSHNAEMSDNESIDSEYEDPLKHAEVYTAEEVCSLTRDKLIRLQDLYTEQFKYLQRILREKKRKYLFALKKERETLASIHNQVRDNPKEYKLYNKLKCLNAYHKRSGVEAILQKRVNDLKAKMADGNTHRPPSFSKCLFTEGGVKCGTRTLPHAKYCLKHILNDPLQVLFRACAVARGDADMVCHEPVPDVFPGQACVFHTDISPLRSYTHMKRDEDDLDSSTELPDSNKPESSPHQSYHLNSLFLQSDNEQSPLIQEQQQRQLSAVVATTSATSQNQFVGEESNVFDMLKVENVSESNQIKMETVIENEASIVDVSSTAINEEIVNDEGEEMVLEMT